MTIVDKLKEKLHIGEPKASPDVPPKQAGTSSSSTPAVPPKDTAAAAPSAVGTSSTSTANPTTAAKKDALPSLPEKEVFDHDKVTVIFVLGGPGAGELARQIKLMDS